MNEPSMFAWCPTYGRPLCIANSIEMWKSLVYEGKKELLILDDGGQYKNLNTSNLPDDVHIVSISKRFSSFGEKQNAACSFSNSTHDILVCWEDDEFYAPWTLFAHAVASDKGELLIPKHYFMEMKDGELRYLWNKRRHDAHAGWAYTRELFRKVEGYSWNGVVTDFGLFTKFMACGAKIVDTTDPEEKLYPYFVTRPYSDIDHLSRMKCDDPWEEAARRADLTPVFRLPDAVKQQDYETEMREIVKI